MATGVRALALAWLLGVAAAACSGNGDAGPPGLGFLDGSGAGDAADAAPDAGADATPQDTAGPDSRPPVSCEWEGQLCDDRDPCTDDDRCTGGVCGGDRALCDDENPCTDDGCRPGLGCFYEPGPADACDDSDPCTTGDRCTDGRCAGTPSPDCVCEIDADCREHEDGDHCNGRLVCDDGRCALDPASVVTCEPDDVPCRDNVCLPATGECVPADVPDGTPCEDGTVCFVQSTCQEGACVGAPLDCNDHDPCTDDTCASDAGCEHAFNSAPCDDGDPATLADRCVLGVCRGTVAECDDGTPCTVDWVDLDDGHCVHDGPAANGARCDDGDPQTAADVCEDGLCRGRLTGCDAGPGACDDGDDCTADACVADECTHTFHTAPCDDGVACTTGDRCEDGRCAGDASGCLPCEPTFGSAAHRLTELGIGADGRVDNALDVDGDPATCAPAGACEDGLDNAFAPLATLVNPSLAAAARDGRLNVLLELPSWPVPVEAFPVNVYTRASLAPDSAGCDIQEPGCAWVVSSLDLDAACRARNHIDDVLYGPRRLVGGGPGSRVVLRWALPGDALVDLPIEDVRLDARAQITGTGEVRLIGVLGGVVWLPALEQALAALPPGALPLPPEELAAFIFEEVAADIDRDGDGVPESASVGLTFRTVAGSIARDDTCQPDCAGRQCGPDGCSGSCGACPAGQACSGGFCLPTGQASCFDVAECTQGCAEGDAECGVGCLEEGDATAQELFLALLACIQENCPTPTEECVESQCWDQALDCWLDT